MCSSGEPPQDYETQEQYADMMQWLEADWDTRFKPIEEQLLGELENRDENTRQQADEARLAAEKSYDATLGMTERNMDMYGTTYDEDQASAMANQQEIGSSGAQIAAGNMARDATTARYDQLEGNMTNLGRGIQGTAISGMSSAAGMEANRNSQNQNIYAQSQAAKWGAVGQVASMAGMALMMSDKNTKTNVKKASTKKALKDVEAVELSQWDYKPGMSAGREEKGHIGGMAQDMPTGMTTRDQKQVDIGDSIMTTIGAVQELSKQVKRLEKAHG